jgi:hypothetical protein
MHLKVNLWDGPASASEEYEILLTWISGSGYIENVS